MTAATAAIALRPPGSKATGVALFFCALVAFASYDAFCKYMLQFYPAPFVNLMRYVAVICIALAMLLRHGDLRLWRVPQKKLLLLRGVMLATVATCFMTALIWMPLAEATAIYFTAPLLMVALSPWLLGEHVRRSRWVAVTVGFAGMLLIVRPGGDLPWLGTVLMAVAAVCYAIFQLLTRRLAGLVPSPVQYAWTALVCLVATAIPAPFFLPAEAPPWGAVALLLAGGACSGAAQWLLLAAFERVEASTLAPLNYFQLLLAVGFSTFWFHKPPDGLALAGIALIVAAGLYLARARPAAGL
ncbi:DMT family transporter [Variovorax sp. J22G21]|uniref:DMT family transporter n=1 Tax=Variovorax fucosicus TaxID=3053517 RepID=UPI0025782EDC|nr:MULTISPECIES: DMT family transporter [unclassified Variovorax]MDM0039364.1 DMT family transporter [Variovorax sp. J22R193]MDM0064139.1 DMT family transporter [Variovorax sp. J22G21]